jgi:60 kDa SS-A/Ro ribonucleoprotein
VQYAKHFSTRETSQSEPIPGKPMVENSAGGFTFAVDDWKRLERFLILGSEGGTFYAKEKKLTVDNAKCVQRCLDEDAHRAISVIVNISVEGRAPKNDAAIFALAMAAGHSDPATRRHAEAVIPHVCRIGTHLFQFIEAVKQFRGWGAGLRKAVSKWYEEKAPGDLAYQVAKYQQRNGVSHRDVLRMCHAAIGPINGRNVQAYQKDAVLRWAIGGKEALVGRTVKRGEAESFYENLSNSLPPFLEAVDEAKTCDRARLIKLIHEHELPRECVPTEELNDVDVWDALLQKMKLTALVRNLGKMTSIGLIKTFSAASKMVADRLGDRDYIKKSRLHPMTILLATRQYAVGHGDKGKLEWEPVAQINDALDAAFYLAFDNVEPTGKRTLLALDVSGSMTSAIGGTSLSCRDASACLAMVTAKKEPHYAILAFTRTLVPVDISACSRLIDVIKRISDLDFGGTDCSLPMVACEEQGVGVDVFHVYTDNETWAGKIHPCQALQRYRQKLGIPAKLAVVGMTATEFSIADPNDSGMLDFVGFDAALPTILNDFAKG